MTQTIQVLIWAGLLVFFIILEAATVQLTSIWFAGGALAALITASLKASIAVQIAVFLIISAGLLVFVYPTVKKKLKTNLVATNADMNIGKQAVVTQRIDNICGTGAVKLSGVEWTARAQGDTAIPAGETVTVMKIDGVKLIVAPAPGERKCTTEGGKQ
ncbi:MAG: NfeD family protein [Oscillospiraceae bacterium]|nr:NfeD family protein [Oscillospiraceae bacterium]